MNELKPCPFCGKGARMITRRRYNGKYEYTPQCIETSCAGRITKIWLDEKKAVEAWNRRIEDEKA